MSGQQPAIVAGRARLARAESRLHPAVQAAMRTYLATARAAVLNHDTSRITATAVGGPEPDQLPLNLDAWPPRAVWERAAKDNVLPVGEGLWRATWGTQLGPDEHAVLPEDTQEFGEYLTDTATRLTGAAWPDDVYDQLHRLVVASAGAGEPLTVLRGKVGDLLALERWSSRARFIARNEALNSLNSAAYASGLTRADLFGETLYKRWLAVPDTSTREAHRLANGQVVAASDLFEVDGERLRYPHDPRASIGNSANCRCLLLWVDQTELAELRAAVPIDITASNPEGSITMTNTQVDTHTEIVLVDDVWSIPSDEEIATWITGDRQDQDEAIDEPSELDGGGVAVTAADFTPSGGPTAAKRKRATTGGNALPGGRFPIENGSDLDKAINAVSLAKGGEAGRRLVRRFIMRQARKLGLASTIPATWNPDGSLKSAGAATKPMAAAYADTAPRLSFVEQVAANVPLEPDPAAFQTPPGPRGTKLHVLNDEGWVAGYIADWQSRHKVYNIPPPRDPYGGGYPKFRRHPVRTSDGQRVMTGPITTNGHGDPTDHTMASVIAHYDDPRYVVANVVPTDAEDGIWVAGSLRAGVSPFQVALLDTYSQSGHWMYDELVASCCVSVPAFELPAQVAPVAALAAAAGDRAGLIEEARCREVCDDLGQRVHLIAAGLVVPTDLAPPAVTASVDAWQLMRDLRAAQAEDDAVQVVARRMANDPGVIDAATRMRKGA